MFPIWLLYFWIASSIFVWYFTLPDGRFTNSKGESITPWVRLVVILLGPVSLVGYFVFLTLLLGLSYLIFDTKDWGEVLQTFDTED